MELMPAITARVIYEAVRSLELSAGFIPPGDIGPWQSLDFADRDRLARAAADSAGPADTPAIRDAIGRSFPLTADLSGHENNLIAAILDALSPGDLPRFASPACEQLAADSRDQYKQMRHALAAMAHYVTDAEDAGNPGAPHEWAFAAGFDHGQASVLTVTTREPNELRVHWTPPAAEAATATGAQLAAYARRHISATRETVAGNPALSSLISFGELPAVAVSAAGGRLSAPGTWSPEETEDFKRRWDAENRSGQSGQGGWLRLPEQVVERKPRIGDRAHYVTDGLVADSRDRCRAATITSLGQIEVSEQNPAGDGTCRQTADLFVAHRDGTSHKQGVLFVPGTFGPDAMRAFVPGEPLPVITCDDLAFAPGTWHFA